MENGHTWIEAISQTIVNFFLYHWKYFHNSVPSLESLILDQKWKLGVSSIQFNLLRVKVSRQRYFITRFTNRISAILISSTNMRWRFEPFAYWDLSRISKKYENHLIFMFCWKRFCSLLLMGALIKEEIWPNAYKFQSNVVQNDETIELVIDKETTGSFCCFY